MHSVYFLLYQEDERVIYHWLEESLYRLATAAASNNAPQSLQAAPA
jgi:hypothetical protein